MMDVTYPSCIVDELEEWVRSLPLNPVLKPIDGSFRVFHEQGEEVILIDHCFQTPLITLMELGAVGVHLHFDSLADLFKGSTTTVRMSYQLPNPEGTDLNKTLVSGMITVQRLGYEPETSPSFSIKSLIDIGRVSTQLYDATVPDYDSTKVFGSDLKACYDSPVSVVVPKDRPQGQMEQLAPITISDDWLQTKLKEAGVSSVEEYIRSFPAEVAEHPEVIPQVIYDDRELLAEQGLRVIDDMKAAASCYYSMQNDLKRQGRYPDA